MSLAEILAATRAKYAAQIPPESQEVMHRSTEDLRRSGIMDRIIKVGQVAPMFDLENHDERRVNSADLLAGGPMMLSFFRGSW
jgi:hypothetical protein